MSLWSTKVLKLVENRGRVRYVSEHNKIANEAFLGAAFSSFVRQEFATKNKGSPRISEINLEFSSLNCIAKFRSIQHLGVKI